MARWKYVKMREETYNKVILIKGTLEQANRVPVSMGDAIDTIFFAACEQLARSNKKELPPEYVLRKEGGDLLRP